MISHFKAIWRRWSLAKVPISGKELHVARYVDIRIGDGNSHAGEAPIHRVLNNALRSGIGGHLSLPEIRSLSFVEKKIAFEIVVKCHSHVQGVAIIERQRFGAFLMAIRSAAGESALDELVEQFVTRYEQVNREIYRELRASAAATIV